MTSVDHVLGLTRQALDEFEAVPLAASLRRAERIARLRGDIHYAHLFQLDLRPNGGSTAWSRTEAYELLKSEEISDVLRIDDRALDGLPWEAMFEPAPAGPPPGCPLSCSHTGERRLFR